MIAHLNGKLVSKLSNEAIIDCVGVGYSVLISLNTHDRLPAVGEKVMLVTLLITREDSMLLYGFHDTSERDAFVLLTSVSGIGPKIALGILSSLTVNELRQFVSEGNLVALVKLPGIGKKTAERMNLELRDKILKLGSSDDAPAVSSGSDMFIREEALSALVTLGYNKLAADKAVKKAFATFKSGNVSAEELIRKSLKFAMS
ncbi:MAG: Holliday junction branch migration protein RuvA [Candidatus Kapabacteria bacterium]|jgi:Holliday junction DNA helicase RuvA|nr:Holliday junction branch migration protein RuvA [Candidatus Kapabacteria bacterium]